MLCASNLKKSVDITESDRKAPPHFHNYILNISSEEVFLGFLKYYLLHFMIAENLTRFI